MHREKFSSVFVPLDAERVHEEIAIKHDDGWRYVQICAINKEESIDLVYSFMKNGTLENLLLEGLPTRSTLPSITDLYLEAFVCENEIHDLFGISFSDLAIDFGGNFYKLSAEFPMTIISPEKLAEREKAKKIEAAKAAKAAREAKGESGSKDGNAGSDDADAELEAKLAAMPPEKAEKVRAAMKAKAAKEKEDADAELEAKLAAMPPEKAEKVRAAMKAKAAKEKAEGE